MPKTRLSNQSEPTLRLHSTIDGIHTYHYTAIGSDGVVAGFVRLIRQSDGATIEERAMTFDDVAGHSPASYKRGH